MSNIPFNIYHTNSVLVDSMKTRTIKKPLKILPPQSHRRSATLSYGRCWMGKTSENYRWTQFHHRVDSVIYSMVPVSVWGAIRWYMSKSPIMLLKSMSIYVGTIPCCCNIAIKKKSSMARSLPVENLLLQKVGSIINYFQ